MSITYDGSETMITARERRLLSYSKKGDRIGFSCISSFCNEPLLEHVRRMADGVAPNLRLLSAVGIDGSGTTRPIIKQHWYGMRMRQPHPGERIFVGLECTADRVRPNGLLDPVFDLSEAVLAFGTSSDARIYYRTGEPTTLYDVAGVRLKLAMKVSYSYDITYDLTGIYYLDCTKILNAIKELSLPAEFGGKPYVREWIMKAAYYIQERRERRKILSNSASDWSDAQKGMAVSTAWFLNSANGWNGGVRLSGWLRGEDEWGWEHCGNGDSVALAFILDRLKTDDWIYVIPSDPSGSHTAEIIRFLDGMK